MDFKYNNEELVFKQPEDDIVCKNCVYAKADYIRNGKVILYGYKGGICDAFSDKKPNNVLFKGESCPKFKAKKKH